MSSTERIVGSAVAAATDGRPVDVVGPRLSGRSSALRHIVEHFRGAGWEVLEVSGRAPHALLPRLDEERAVIAVDDWEHLDDETRTVLRNSGSTLITTRVGGDPAVEDMQHLALPRLDADELRVLLTRVLGVVLDRDDALALSTLTDGVIGAAIGIANIARESGDLTVVDGRGSMTGSWVDNAGPVVETMLAPLTPARQEALAGIAQSAVVRGFTGDACEELVSLGYLEELPDDAVRVASTLLRRWFTRS